MEAVKKKNQWLPGVGRRMNRQRTGDFFLGGAGIKTILYNTIMIDMLLHICPNP